MKKIFIVILGLIVALSAFGIFDTVQRNKKAEELKSKTVVFYGQIEKIEDVDGKSKFVIAGTTGSGENFVGKRYSFVEGDTVKAFDGENKEAELSLFKEGDQVIIQHIGDIVEGDINELTGEIIIAPFTNQVTNPTDASSNTEPTK